MYLSPSIRSLVAAIAFCFAGATAVQAHSVWIEDLPDGTLAVRFGEPGGEVEKSPGYLDNLAAVTAWTHADGKPKPFAVSKRADHFLIEQSTSTQSIQAETAFPVRKARKPLFYARWQPMGLESAGPALPLDIVPTGKPGEVRVYFRGKPLPSAKLTLHIPKAAEVELSADADGFAQVGDAKESGLYLLTCAGHSEPLPGFSGGAAYEIASHNAALAWRRKEAPPATKR